MTVRFVRFRKHRRPCGQPAAVGEIGRFRPVPAQAGHLIRIKATPSDFPFKSTGLATYPEPPQFGQSSGATLSPPRVKRIVPDVDAKFTEECFPLRNPNKLLVHSPIEPQNDHSMRSVWAGLMPVMRNVGRQLAIDEMTASVRGTRVRVNGSYSRTP